MTPSPASADRTAGHSREFDLTEKDFDLFATLAERETGIFFHGSKQALVYSRLVKRLRALQMRTFAEYYALISAPGGEREKSRMIDALTTNVTRFFREPHHFEHFRRRALQGAIAHVKAGGRFRIWSAGCSTGQEPYSIALTILSQLPDAEAYDIRILATDISESALASAATARFPMEELSGIPKSLLHPWTTKKEHELELGDAARSLITFKKLNLLQPWPMVGPFDAVFCRNVMIYFKEDVQSRIWERFSGLMANGAFLYIGHSERMVGPAARHFAVDGITTYKKFGGNPP